MFLSKSRGSDLLLLAIFSLILSPTEARPIQFPSWLTNVLPQKGATVADEIKCYSLPYGGIGFLSHVLTYWTILVLGFGRKPYWPWSRLSAGKFDLCLSIVQVIITVAIAAFTIARCRSRWQFVLISVWKLVMSVVVGVWGISASRNAIKASKYELLPKTKADSEKEPSIPRIWSSEDGTWLTLLIYAAAAVVGLVGLISLVVENFWVPGVWKITTVFGSLILGTGLAFLALWWCVDASGEKKDEHRHTKALLRGLGFSSLGVVPTLMLVLAAFFSDWVLGALAGNLVGVPSDDNSYLYWVSNVCSSWRLAANRMARRILQRKGYRSSLLDLRLCVQVVSLARSLTGRALHSAFESQKDDYPAQGHAYLYTQAKSHRTFFTGLFLARWLRYVGIAL